MLPCACAAFLGLARLRDVHHQQRANGEEEGDHIDRQDAGQPITGSSAPASSGATTPGPASISDISRWRGPAALWGSWC
jgi:hypothetical protein